MTSLVLLAAIGLALPPARGEPPARPNILFILADDWGWGDLGCYGHARIKTPRLDRLAREGTLFTSFYSSASVCSPSRAAFLTGRFPARLGLHGHLATHDQNAARGMPDRLDPAILTLPDLLRGEGYATGHYGKWHLGDGPDAPADHGFDEWKVVGPGPVGWDFFNDLEARPGSSAAILDAAGDFIERHRDRPFYVQAWLCDVHATLNPTAEQLAAYRGMARADLPFTNAHQVYWAAATDADRQIGRLLDRLDGLGLAENTIVVFSSDNGPEEIAIGNAGHSGVGSPGPFRGRKRSLYDGGIRVPFLVRWPAAMPAGRVDDATAIAGVDFLPSLCTLAGVPVPLELPIDGEDLSAALRGEVATRTKPLYWEWRFRIFGHVWNASPRLAARRDRWKFLINPDRSRAELYDVVADPGEQSNLAAAHPELVGPFADELIGWSSSLPPGPIDPGAGRADYPWPTARRDHQ